MENYRTVCYWVIIHYHPSVSSSSASWKYLYTQGHKTYQINYTLVIGTEGNCMGDVTE